MNPQDSVPVPVPVSVPVSVTPQKVESFRQLFRFSWNFFNSNWQVLVPIILIPSVVTAIGEILSTSSRVLGLVVNIVGIILSIAMAPAAVDAIRRRAADSSAAVSLASQYKFGFGLFWSMVFLSIISGLAEMGSVILFIIPGIIVGVYVAFNTLTLVIDGKKGYAALFESYTIVYGRLEKVFTRFLLLGIVFVVLYIVIGIIESIVGLPGVFIDGLKQAGAGAPTLSLGTQTILVIINLAVSSIVTPITLIFTYRLYTSLKETRAVNVSTKKFKNWLVVFTCIGVVIALVGITIWAVLWLGSGAKF